MVDEFVPQTVAEVTSQSPRQSLLIIPIAIVIGFAIVGAAIFFSGNGLFQKDQTTLNSLSTTNGTDSGKIPPVTAGDHILGNPNAPIVVVEYSDLDCPYCQAFQTTMHQVMDAYGPSGKVAWVFREFPIQQAHPDAPALALDAECVAKIGGNDAFWKFIDEVFTGRDATQETDMAQIPSYVAAAGVDDKTFQNCVNNASLKTRVTQEFNDAINAGAKGTPFTVVLVGGQQGVIQGVRSFTSMKKVIDTLLTQLEGPQAATSTNGSSTLIPQ